MLFRRNKKPRGPAPVPRDSPRWVPADTNEQTKVSISRPLTGTEVEMYHLDGVAWFDAPVPSKNHACWAQTYAYYGLFDLIQRCACGAVRDAHSGRWSPWIDRNTRKVQSDA